MIILGSNPAIIIKKLLLIIILSMLVIGKVAAQTKNIGNGLSINIPKNYEYFELTFEQLISRFPNIDYINLEDWGVGMNSKIIVIANKKSQLDYLKI